MCKIHQYTWFRQVETQIKIFYKPPSIIYIYMLNHDKTTLNKINKV